MWQSSALHMIRQAHCTYKGFSAQEGLQNTTFYGEACPRTFRLAWLTLCMCGSSAPSTPSSRSTARLPPAPPADNHQQMSTVTEWI